MKTFQIEDAKKRFFNSKEDYLKFKQAWKDFHNSDKLKWYKNVDITFWDAPATQERVYARTKFTALNAEHYMLYNLVRGYEITRGFAPLTNEKRMTENLYKCDYKPHKWQNCQFAANEIIRAGRALTNVNDQSTRQRENARKKVDHMLLPFGDTLSHESLATIASLLYKCFSEEDMPKIIVEKYKVIKDAPPAKETLVRRKTLADKIREWRAA